jgi:hypothetical protein
MTPTSPNNLPPGPDCLEQLHQPGIGLVHRSLDARLDRGDPPVQAAYVGDQLGGELMAGARRSAGRTDLVEERGGAVGGQIPSGASGD